MCTCPAAIRAILKAHQLCCQLSQSLECPLADSRPVRDPVFRPGGTLFRLYRINQKLTVCNVGVVAFPVRGYTPITVCETGPGSETIIFPPLEVFINFPQSETRRGCFTRRLMSFQRFSDSAPAESAFPPRLSGKFRRGRPFCGVILSADNPWQQQQ
uniref:(northern house mosquito) hypothetical protein n=1 Tax=Culex pipiens TaxID=7175 RepID=A0A8D8BU19_CULPI